MNNIFHFVPFNVNSAVIIRGQSIECGTDWDFEYIDITAEFQILIIRFLKIKKSATNNDISNTFGIPINITKNLMIEMINRNIVEYDNSNNYILSDYGMSISGLKQIIDKETVFFVSEICLETNTFLGQTYNFIDKNQVNISDISNLIKLDEIVNLPENAVNIASKGYILNNHDTFTIIQSNNMIKISSTTGNEVSISNKNLNLALKQKLELQNNVKNHKQKLELQNNVKNHKEWFNTATLEYKNIKFSYLNNDTAAIEIKDLSYLDDCVRFISNNLTQLILHHKELDNVMIMRKTKLRGANLVSAKLLLLSILEEKTNELERNFRNVAQVINDTWNKCKNSDEAPLPDIEEIISLSYDNELFNLLRILKSMEDIYAETY